MIPIDSYIQLAVSFFEIPLDVIDTAFETVGGIDQKTVTGIREIQAAVDPSRSKEMERIFGGSISDGDIGIYTTSELHIDDAHDPGNQRKQSFVQYQMLPYRISNLADWKPQAGLNVYLAKRHSDPNPFAEDSSS